jgi:Xaa-Pro aminopeptidase
MTNIHNRRLSNLREKMITHRCDAYIIPSSDPHQSEYVASYYQSRAWVSGFTGSMGTAVVTKDSAEVWTDSRYFVQAEQELAGSSWKLQKMKVQGAPEHIEWLAKTLPEGAKVGFDGRLFTIGQIRAMEASFKEKNISIVHDFDLVNEIWTENRLPLSKRNIFEHDILYAGRSRSEKLLMVREKMSSQNADFHLISTLDDIGWLFNLRGYDVACNPVFYAYALIGTDSAYLFVDGKKVPVGIRGALAADGIVVKPYDNINSFLEILTSDKNILIDANTTSVFLFNKIKNAKVKEADTIPILLKAIKNEVEIKGTKNAMVKDGVALVKAFRWIEKEVKKRSISEVEIAEKLAYFRSRMPLYYGESFDAIVGFKGNGAIVHYRPEEGTCAHIEGDGMLLIDSGGQYQDGTTDITRTIYLGTPSEEEKKAYTLVLKGHIAVAMLKFPKGTKGIQMDILARMFLWQHGLNYGHGTGHGVGCFMNVHEPPQGIVSGLNSRGTTPHEVGMFTSNEPGYYKEGAYGIRVENLVFVVDAGNNEGTEYHSFDTVTLFPIDTTLINKALMTKDEKLWLNEYHSNVFEKLSPSLSPSEVTWLKKKCKAI